MQWSLNNIFSVETKCLSIYCFCGEPLSPCELNLILSYLILSYLILSYLILFYLILSYIIFSFLILSYLILARPAEDRHILLLPQRLSPRWQEGRPLLHRQEPQQPFGERALLSLPQFYPRGIAHGIKFSTESPLCHFGFKIRRRER